MKAQAGDRQALEALLAEVRPRAYAVALRVLRNRDDAEDAVQDAYLKIWRNLNRFEGRASFSTWLHRIVMNASLDILRRQLSRGEKAPAEHDQDSTPEPAEELTPESMLAAAETQGLVGRAVAQLSAVHLQAITLREFQDMSYAEIAAEAGCPIGTVMSRLHHARHKVTSMLLAMVEDESELRAA